jgi:hypothetical protein
MSTYDYLEHGIVLTDKDVNVRRISRRTRIDVLREILDILSDQYNVDLFLTENASFFNTAYTVFVCTRDLCTKVGVRIRFTYDEIFYGSHEDVISKIISSIEKTIPVKVCSDKLIPRLCTCCNAPLPTHSNTCEYCGVSHDAASGFDRIASRNLREKVDAI